MSAGEVQAGKQTNQGYRYNGSSLSGASAGTVLKPPKQNGKNISISGTLTAIAAGVPQTLTNAQANKLEKALAFLSLNIYYLLIYHMKHLKYFHFLFSIDE